MIQDLTKYLLEKSQTTQSMSQAAALLSPESDAQVGLILSERFINMPAEIVTPMYTMLQEELQWALQEKEPYNFSHYLILSKTYTEIESKLDQEENRPQKKGKKGKAAEPTVFYFHAEDEALHQHALEFCNFDYTNQGDEGASDAKRAFQEAGIRPQGHMTLLEADKFAAAIKAVGEYLSSA